MRIFVAALSAGELTIRGDEHHYLARVRRAVVGDSIELLDGEGLRADATIKKITDTESTLEVGSVQQIIDQPPRIRALLPLIKGDRMDIALEKLVETGVDDIVVWPAARAVVKLDNERRPARIEHYQSIAQAAARQSGRASVPTVAWADSLSAAVATAVTGGARFALDPAADRTDLRAALARPAATTLPFDQGDAKAFDESTDVAVTGRYRRPDVPPPDARDPDDVTSTGRFVRVSTSPRLDGSDWPLSADPASAFVDAVTIVTGPEGGLAPAELDALAAAGFTSVGLGPRVLRAETAPAVIVALVRALTRS